MNKFIREVMMTLSLYAALALCASGQMVLEYEPTRVTVTGMLEVVVFPGRPNYNDVNQGDEPQHILMLSLEHPVDVIASPLPPGADPEGWPNKGSYTNLTNMHVVRPADAPAGRWSGRAPVRVCVEGTLMEGHNAHHKTGVVLFSTVIRECLN